MTATADLMAGFQALEDAAPEYEKADRYATGSLPERFTTARIRAKLLGSGDAYRFRLARKPITALTNRVGISSIKSSKGEAADKRIDLIRRANDMEIQEPFIIDRAATYGDAYVLVVAVDQEDGEEATETRTPAEELLREAGVEIRYQSPLNTRAMYDAEDGRRCRYVIRRWRERRGDTKVWRVELWYLGYRESWISDPDANGTDENQWHRWAEGPDGEDWIDPPEEFWREEYDGSQIAIRHLRTGLPYGRPQHADAYGPQDAITKAIVTQVEVDLEAHGYPERARLVDEKAQEDTARDQVPWDDDTDAPKVGEAQVTTGPIGGPGTERVYRATKSIQQFDPPDPGLLVSPLQLWVRLMSTATDTPLWEFDPEAGSGMSGYARWLAEKPLRDREAAFKRYLGQFVKETYALALEIVEIEAGDITVEWSPGDVTMDPEWWATASVRREHGVPQEEILSEAGYLPSKVEEFLDAQADQRFWSERVRTLKDLAEALNTLSGPVSLGIVDAAKVSALVDTIMREAGDPAIGGDGVDRTPEPAPALPPGREGETE